MLAMIKWVFTPNPAFVIICCFIIMVASIFKNSPSGFMVFGLLGCLNLHAYLYGWWKK